ncbi:ABC transporter substrate-binding protein [Cohnella algarum]|uniref:ABC transporter substrate-binding protein n=1 Tax=Cohnella algarum TaxID=2044859 RepID=UPI0019684BC6|nr:extracellular solute-binding protein [Cohnella algarum]MBN2983780.1 extracellular solute-binding protein [Cohnella algarum]
MRKILLALACCLLVLSAAACSGNGNGGESLKPSGSTNAANGETNATPKPSGAGSGKAPIGPPATDEEKTVVFSAYDYNEVYEEAKRKYEELHPNITIEVNYLRKGMNDLDGKLLEQFRMTTGAEMLAGQGPDLLDMTWLPTDQYAGKGLLLNLSEAIAGDPTFDADRYFTNILDNVNPDGNLYAIPLSFMLNGLIGDRQAIEKAGVAFDDQSWNWAQFSETGSRLAEAGEYEYGYVYKAPENLVYDLVSSNYPALVDEANRQANFEGELFVGLLDQIRDMETNKALTLDARNFEKSYFIDMTLSSVEDYFRVLNESIYQKNPKFYANPKADGMAPGGFFSTAHNVAINANSSVKAEAWDFLKFLMNEKKQAYGFPINKSAYEERIDELVAAGELADAETGKTFPVTEADRAALDELLARAVHSKADIPPQIESTLFSELPAFFSGQKSAEAVAKLIQNKVTTYLNE